MIKANELMIGNWVYSPEEENVMVESVGNKWCSVRTAGDGKFHVSYECPTANLKPIELTPDILIKFGFILDSTETVVTQWSEEPLITKYYSYNDKFTIKYRPQAPYMFTHGNYNLNILYLHQLQNLYFSLTGEELKINL